MSYSKLILRDSAEIVWPLDDLTESSSVSKAINFLYDNSYSFSASINSANSKIIHTPIIFGGGQSLSLTSSAVGLSIPALGRFSELYSNKNSCISFWLQIDGLTTEERTIFKKRNFNNVGLFIKDNYLTFRYGTSASYIEVSGDLSNPEEPNHILIGKTPLSLLMMINGVLYTSKNSLSVSLDKDDNYEQNDYLDFYGTSDNSWIVDSISFYSNILSQATAKKHYVYGLGKNIGDEVFHHRGGTIYNFSNISTEKLISIDWRYPQQWINATLTDLNNDIFGISPIQFNEPDFYYYSSEILTASNSISFRNISGAISSAAYIDITSLFSKIGSGDYPFFVKVKLDGPVPDISQKQRILSIGDKPDKEILQFNLYNDSASFKLLIESFNSASASFDIKDIQDKPYIYFGMKFSDHATFYFSQSGSAIQSTEFNYLNSNNYGLDPLVEYFPLSNNKILRIGSAISYDRTNYSTSLPSVSQFGGTFQKFIVYQKDFTASASYNYLDNYKKSKYQISFDSTLNRFKTYSYGHGTFNIHAIDMSEFITDDNQKIGANVINVGYPDITSSSQVLFYVTHLDYEGNVIYPKTKLSQNNYLNFINNTNLAGTYLKFDFELYSQDSNYYPPRIKNFSMETYKAKENYVSMRHDDGEKYILYQSSSAVFLPEIKKTPNIFLTKYSGIKLSETFADFKDDFASQPLDPRTIKGLKLWLDSRFINGLNNSNPNDDSRVIYWKDLSDNTDAFQSTGINAPIFRLQSKNIFTNNQLNGTESGSISGIVSNNLNIYSSSDGVASGRKSIKLTPDGSSVDSYIYMSNTASISVYPNQDYSVVGTITLLKPQSSSALHNLARTISIYLNNGSGMVFSASSQQAVNSIGSHMISINFTTTSSTESAEIRFYNGSSDVTDSVYWDNLALYPSIENTLTASWVQPLTTILDFPVVKFNNNTFLECSASSNYPNSLYLVARNFNDGIFLQSTTASILYSNSASYFISYGSPQNYAESNNIFKIFSILNNGTSASLFINGQNYGVNNTGALNINKLFIGRNLNGDIASILLFDEINTEEDRQKIESWLNESFPIY